MRQSRMPKQARQVVRVLLYAAFIGLLAHVLHTAFGLGGQRLDSFFNDWVYNVAMVLAALACLGRAVLVRSARPAWTAIGGGLLSWAIGDIYWTLELSDRETIPYPSLADAFYVAIYPAFYIGVGLLVRARHMSFQPSLWLDGVIGGLAVAAIGAALLYPAIQGSTEGDAAAVATNLAYPLGDLLLLSFVVGVLALTGWRPGRAWILIAVGLSVNAVADAVFLYQDATGTYREGTVLDSLWLVGSFTLACAAWNLDSRPTPIRLDGLRVLVMPSCFALAAVGLQVYAQFEPVNSLATGLATATLVAVIVRMVVTFEDNLRLLRDSRREALTDPLTGLGNRRRLLFDLALATRDAPETEPHLFGFFDLDGFKAYNDSFGHPAGDALLSRLGRNLTAAVRPDGRAYRHGGDEFCVLAPISHVKPESIAAAASAALTEEGEAFSIGNSRGVVLLPQEAGDAATALRLADRRMYAQKSRHPRSAERQTRNVLLRVLREREPRLGEHLDGVARLAVALGQRLELNPEELDVVARAAELHDVGKMAIPDELLRKTGPLDEVEWRLMRGHTVAGERILAAAPAMVPVAKLVRSTHERWDGNGYPDKLSREEIPLGARMIAVCDAFEAMVEQRPWRTPLSDEQAVAELRRCAGTQFDPHLVEVFCRDVFPELERDWAERRPAAALAD